MVTATVLSRYERSMTLLLAVVAGSLVAFRDDVYGLGFVRPMAAFSALGVLARLGMINADAAIPTRAINLLPTLEGAGGDELVTTVISNPNMSQVTHLD